MYIFAQTNLQLFHQLRHKNYSEADLVRIHEAYQLANKIFTGFFRGSGKPFIAHLVGTASILVSVNASIEIVAGGLLHAVYEFGDFGDGGRGMSSQKRLQMKQQMGEKIENYIAQYTLFKWNQENIINTFHSFDKIDHEIKDILLMRLANELEDHLDGGMVYSGKLEKHLEKFNSCNHLMVKMAMMLGYSSLANTLNQVFQETLSLTIPSSLQNNNPYSYILTTSSPLKRFIGQWRYRLVNFLKRNFNSKD